MIAWLTIHSHRLLIIEEKAMSYKISNYDIIVGIHLNHTFICTTREDIKRLFITLRNYYKLIYTY